MLIFGKVEEVKKLCVAKEAAFITNYESSRNVNVNPPFRISPSPTSIHNLRPKNGGCGGRIYGLEWAGYSGAEWRKCNNFSRFVKK